MSHKLLKSFIVALLPFVVAVVFAVKRKELPHWLSALTPGLPPFGLGTTWLHLTGLDATANGDWYKQFIANPSAYPQWICRVYGRCWHFLP